MVTQIWTHHLTLSQPRGQIMPATLLLALPRIFRPFYGPNECSELTSGTVDCPK
jgi:hypothetical protein